jgi:RNA polymerase sigma-70 factor (ECF subfamily)
MSDSRLVELYRVYGATVYARCRRILGEGQEAEDATQETFLRIHRHLHKAPDTHQVLAWIYRIATNYCLNELRSRRSRPKADGELHDRASRDAPLDHVLANRQLALRVLHEVPEKLRVPAWLHFVDGVAQTDVATILGISRRTVVNRLAQFETEARRILG